MEAEMAELDEQKSSMAERKDAFQKQINDLLLRIEKEMESKLSWRNRRFKCYVVIYLQRLTILSMISVFRQVESTKDARKQEATKGLEYYRERLGLRFAKESSKYR